MNAHFATKCHRCVDILSNESEAGEEVSAGPLEKPDNAYLFVSCPSLGAMALMLEEIMLAVLVSAFLAGIGATILGASVTLVSNVLVFIAVVGVGLYSYRKLRG